MATDTRELSAPGTADRPPTSPRPKSRVGAALCACFAGLAAFVGWLLVRLRLRRAAKARATPVVHEDVVLSQAGAEVWKQAMGPDSPVGKPTNHRRRRLPGGGAP
jgi:hypothetical protein